MAGEIVGIDIIVCIYSYCFRSEHLLIIELLHKYRFLSCTENSFMFSSKEVILEARLEQAESQVKIALD